jgi:hypothetical protein
VKWLSSFQGKNLTAEKCQMVFRDVCSRGYIQIAQWLYDKYGDGVFLEHRKRNEIFEEVCVKGQLSVLHWLYSLGGVDICAKNDVVFHTVCRKGHKDVAEWLYDHFADIG